MKRSLLKISMLAALFSMSAHANPGPTVPAANSDIDQVKGTVGIVCVNNAGDKLTWYPAAANASLIANKLQKCFEEVALKWDGYSLPHSGLPDESSSDVPTPEEAYGAFMRTMQLFLRVAP